MNKRRISCFRRPVCLAVMLALAGPSLAMAQNTQREPDASEVNEPPPKDQTSSVDMGAVIVTANKRSQSLHEVPMAVSVLSGTQLSRQNASGFADYASQVPGLTTISSGAGWTQLVLRGVTTGSHQANATVGTYIDNTPYGSSTIYAAGSMLTPDIDPHDLERIEVLRGPQGTLYGSNTLGGLVKFVTTPPDTHRAGGYVSTGFESVSDGGHGWDTHATVNIPVVKDSVGLRVNAYARTDPGYIDNVSTGEDDVNEAQVRGGRAQLLWTPDDDVSVRFSALAQNLSSDGLANGGIDIDPATAQPIHGWHEQARAPGTGMFKVKYRLYDLTVKADLDWADFISVSSYGTLRANRNFDLTPTFGPLLNGMLGVPGAGYSEWLRISMNKVTQEFRLQSPEDRTWEWRVGLYYTREDTDQHQDILGFDAATGAPLALPPLGTVSLGPARFTEWAGYGDITWHATPRLSILVGARYSADKTTYSQTASGLLTGATHFSSESSDHPVTFLFNPKYKFSDNVMGYVRVASGFRPGGANVGVPPGLGAPQTFDPDKLVSYEMGLKSLLLDRRMRVDIAAYYIDWSKVQLTTTKGGFSFLGNGGKAEIRGVEASWRYNPMPGLLLWSNATYTQAELAANTPAGSVHGEKGDPLPYVPEWSANVGFDYNFPMGGWSGFIGGNYSYVGERTGEFNPVPAPRVQLPRYNNINVYLGANVANWTLKLYVKNLADQHGLTSAWPETINPVASPFKASVQRPRTVGLSATVNF
ncbi:MAG TPA: TonB-dependent receptor [Oleiagrimonas sp.]|nr:TonB-dependent receptor [Oleiagrimonas sp.]